MRTNQWLAIISFLGASACARTVAPPVPSEEPHTGVWIVKSEISYKGTERNFRANMQIRMREDSLLWVSFSPGFGLEILRVRMDTAEAVVLNRFEASYSVYSYADLGQRYGIPLSYALCEALLMGRLPSDMLRYQPITRPADTVQVFVHPEDGISLYVKDKQLEKVEAQDASGRRIVLTYTRGPMLTVHARLFVRCPEPCTLVDVLRVRHKEIRRQEKTDFPFEIPAEYTRR